VETKPLNAASLYKSKLTLIQWTEITTPSGRRDSPSSLWDYVREPAYKKNMMAHIAQPFLKKRLGSCTLTRYPQSSPIKRGTISCHTAQNINLKEGQGHRENPCLKESTKFSNLRKDPRAAHI
jgi:hypothetical protein